MKRVKKKKTYPTIWLNGIKIYIYIYNIHGTSKFGVGIILCVCETWKLIQQPLLQYSVVLSMVKTIELLFHFIFLESQY